MELDVFGMDKFKTLQYGYRNDGKKIEAFSCDRKDSA